MRAVEPAQAWALERSKLVQDCLRFRAALRDALEADPEDAVAEAMLSADLYRAIARLERLNSEALSELERVPEESVNTPKVAQAAVMAA